MNLPGHILNFNIKKKRYYFNMNLTKKLKQSLFNSTLFIRKRVSEFITDQYQLL